MSTETTLAKGENSNPFTEKENFWISLTGLINTSVILVTAIAFFFVHMHSNVGNNITWLVIGYLLLALVCNSASRNGMLDTKEKHPDHMCVGFTPLFILRAGALVWPLVWLFVLIVFIIIMSSSD